MGRKSGYQSTFTLPWIETVDSSSSENHFNTWPDGLHATAVESAQNGQRSESSTLPDGTSFGDTLGADPVWGIQVPIAISQTLTKGTLAMKTADTRATTLSTAGDPLTVNTQTDTDTTNGRTYKSAFTRSNQTWLNTSPVGRTVTTRLDGLERPASTQIAGLTATTFAYDTRGRPATVIQGTRKTTFAYNSAGFLASITDPLLLTSSYTYDANGRVLSTKLPDGRVIGYGYDANGNLTSVTPPGKPAHALAYNPVDLLSSYTPPAVSGTGPTKYAYNLDRDLTTITRADGQTITYGYDTAGRISSITTPTGTNTFTYNSTTGNLAVAANSVEHITYSYNGPLPAGSAWSGTVAGSVGRTYNNNFWPVSQSINGANTINFTYDNDGLVTAAGLLTISRSATNGLISGTTLGVVTDNRTYNSFGELMTYTAMVKGVPVYKFNFTRNTDSRITANSESIDGAANSYSYDYDAAGRLDSATKNSATDIYSFDTNSNRLSITNSSGTTKATYDAQDRLLTYGSASYTYTANGELTSQTVGGQKTAYTYDVLGNLIDVTLPNGKKITYVIDTQNNRVSKAVNGVLTTGFLYDGTQIVAQLNGSNQVVSRFVYATNANSPDYMISGGVTYRILSDQLGSPRVIVNSSTGAIAEEISYDEFGNVIGDTNLGFQPFGFAGGLYDQDTKLVRFGARDYNSSIGRWTAKDPIRFDGSDANLYDYVLQDPVNRVDPSGLGGGLECKKKYTVASSGPLSVSIDTSGNIVIELGPFSTTIAPPLPTELGKSVFGQEVGITTTVGAAIGFGRSGTTAGMGLGAVLGAAAAYASGLGTSLGELAEKGILQQHPECKNLNDCNLPPSLLGGFVHPIQ
jgi:RHS repeat-associated protein